MNENLQKLYTNLRNDYGENFNVDYNTFVKDMDDDSKRTRLYENMRNDYGTNFTKSFEEFSNDIGFGTPYGIRRSSSGAVTPQAPSSDDGVPKNAAKKQTGFWKTVFGDILENLGAGVANTAGGLIEAHDKLNPVMQATKYIAREKGYGDRIPDIPSAVLGIGKKLSERGDRFGLMKDPETGDIKKVQFDDLWKQGRYLSALGEIMLTATESAPTSALAMAPGGLALVSLSSAGQKYNELDNNPETKDMPEWKKLLNASVSGTIEGLTEKGGAFVDKRMIAPFLEKMTETTVKKILAKGGVNALIQTITEGIEEVVSQVGGNSIDAATGVTDTYKPLEGVLDAFVYGQAAVHSLGAQQWGCRDTVPHSKQKLTAT
jgi:hypothetical protein